ncbi:MAG: tetratricopeptide repeat protein [Euryarchaeota archaeon]|nr:tetratricopeptide repeat protein [Euryarchaeota archaeon]
MENDLFAAYDSNPNFTGREDILDRLRAASGSERPTALVGADGNGKTLIAAEYARARMTEYDFVCWVRAGDPITLISDYAELNKTLGLPDTENLVEAAEAVLIWLEQYDRWLLIFDDASDPGTLADYLPRGGSGQVVITSSKPGWDEVAATLVVGTLDRAGSVRLLLRRSGREDVKAAEALAEALGDLPLALEMAGAYIAWTGVSLSRYLEMYKKRLQEIDPRGIPAPVAAAFEISFEQVWAVSSKAVEYLNMCALLAPQDLPIDLLIGASVLLPQDMETATEVLSRRGLVGSGKNQLSVHPLVQALALRHLDEESKKSWIEATLVAMGGAFSTYMENIFTWPECARLLPHVLTALEHEEEEEEEEAGSEAASKTASTLLNQVGLYLHRRSYFAGAKEVLERLLTLDEMTYGQDHPEVATDLNNLGSLLRVMGDLDGAKAMLERALAIEEAAEETDSLKIAIRANNLGTVLRVMGDLEGAKAMFQRALALDEAAYGPNHLKTAIRINNMGEVLQDLGDLEGARGNYEQALLTFQRLLGEGHHYTQRAQDNLDSLYEEEGSS